MADKVGFIASGEVFYILDLVDFPMKERYETGLLNNPIFVDASSVEDISIGSLYDGEFFYDAEDVQKTNPLPSDSPVEEAGDGGVVVKIVGISDEKVFMIARMADNFEGNPMKIAGLLSNPSVVDLTNFDNVEVGWTWDGESFNPPA